MKKQTPGRIVSLVPSQTELLYSLGLGDKVVGITRFCVHPQEWFNSKTRIGGTKNVNIEKILALRPDLIIANKEENNKEQVEALAKEVPVWVSDVKNLGDACEMILDIGKITDKMKEAELLANEIKKEFQALQAELSSAAFPDAVYLIWRKPFMTIGGDSFINDMLLYAGINNLYKNSLRYPVISIEELKKLQPALILLSSEPYPFQEKHVEELQNQLPYSTIILVDGELFSWYGSRLLLTVPYFRQLRERLRTVSI